ncbi:MAG: potassium channel family protein [Bacteroidetes bacterium]|nr:potassium channel family protein [Bacteroidota bacterium]
MPKKLNKLWYALGLSTLGVLTGVIGFVMIEGYSVLNSFYMAIITISTVGFKEVQPLSDGGKIFTAYISF